jgi:hypothetical protein
MEGAVRVHPSDISRKGYASSLLIYVVYYWLLSDRGGLDATWPGSNTPGTG